MDVDDLDPWCASYMAHRREKIEAEVPYVDLDWSEFAVSSRRKRDASP